MNVQRWAGIYRSDREEFERGDEKKLPRQLNPLLFSADLLGFVYLD